jgi:hypothetical protein
MATLPGEKSIEIGVEITINSMACKGSAQDFVVGKKVGPMSMWRYNE